MLFRSRTLDSIVLEARQTVQRPHSEPYFMRLMYVLDVKSFRT